MGCNNQQNMECDHPQNVQNENDSEFVWDENSQLYFHPSSGFYHDPSAGWYYSTKDGLYYKFEEGNYVLLSSNEVAPQDPALPAGSCQQIDGDNDEIYATFIESISECDQQMGTVSHEVSHGDKFPLDCKSSPSSEKPPPPPSEWLEDTLIDLYLSGYNKIAEADNTAVPVETDDGAELEAEGTQDNDTYELEEGEWIPEDEYGVADTMIDEDEEKWRAQYGQVIDHGKEVVSEFPSVDLWEWEMVRGFRKDGKEVARLVGRLVKRSTKLHPSMPSGGGKLRSAPICEAHLDLVRVKTGQVYKLRNPSASYLASLSTYDSANPTKEWGFPPLSSDWEISHSSKSGESSASASGGVCKQKGLPVLPNQIASLKKRSSQYRDRAAERRMLHGPFSIGPGQKNSVGVDNDTPSSPSADCPLEAAAEALEMTFGDSSYARKIMKSMGWKEGERLGSSTKGLLEPIQPVGNMGNAGLGWSHHERRR